VWKRGRELQGEGGCGKKWEEGWRKGEGAEMRWVGEERLPGKWTGFSPEAGGSRRLTQPARDIHKLGAAIRDIMERMAAIPEVEKQAYARAPKAVREAMKARKIADGLCSALLGIGFYN